MASSTPTPLTQEPDDLDRPFTDEELQAIDDAVFQYSTTTSSKRHAADATPSSSSSSGSNKKSRRRLPDSLFIFHQNNCDNNNSNSFSLSPCHPRNRFRSNAFRPSSSTSSYQGNVMMRYPEMAFGGRIVYSRSFDEVGKSAEELLSFVEAKRRKGGQAILGFDIEWRPTFRRDALHYAQAGRK